VCCVSYSANVVIVKGYLRINLYESDDDDDDDDDVRAKVWTRNVCGQLSSTSAKRDAKRQQL